MNTHGGICCPPPTHTSAKNVVLPGAPGRSVQPSARHGCWSARPCCRLRGSGFEGRTGSAPVGACWTRLHPTLRSLGTSPGHQRLRDPAAIRPGRPREAGVAPPLRGWCPGLTWTRGGGGASGRAGRSGRPSVRARACVLAAETRHLPLAEVREPGASQWPGSGRRCAWVCPQRRRQQQVFLGRGPGSSTSPAGPSCRRRAAPGEISSLDKHWATVAPACVRRGGAAVPWHER